MKNSLFLAMKGFAMGIAETIPGVSGGTIAFITGIYEDLLNSIKAFGPELISGFKDSGISGAWKAINGNFLVVLLIGMAVGLVSGVFGVVHLLENYPPVIWAFFFGLIIASVIYIGGQVEKWQAGELIGFVLATAIAFGVTVLTPAQGSEALWFVFISGAIAISALILPGISGSFMLLIMGMYSLIIPSLKSVLTEMDQASLIIILVFALGAIFGLASFSRILSWTFKNYRSVTLATLTGFMVGSLGKIWPWRNVLQYRTNSRGEQVPFIEDWVMPGQYEGDPLILFSVLAAVAGFSLVFFLSKFDEKTEH
ncbi:MAG: DUF368 domain-containing protein [Saprospiraceae bacterium]|nr:DUF368 domain-containing protein [Saprospiraceae bacterium]